jgi:hypothetical protein
MLACTKVLALIGKVNVFPGKPEFGAALGEALASAEEWLAGIQENGG